MGWFSKKKEEDFNRSNLPELPTLPERTKSFSPVMQVIKEPGMPTDVPEVEIHELPDLPEPPKFKEDDVKQHFKMAYPVIQSQPMQRSNFSMNNNDENYQNQPQGLPPLPEINPQAQQDQFINQQPNQEQYNQVPDISLIPPQEQMQVQPIQQNFQQQIIQPVQQYQVQEPTPVIQNQYIASNQYPAASQSVYSTKDDSKISSRKVEPIFIRLDKFESTVEAFEDIKSKIGELEDLFAKSRDLKLREEQELSDWDKEIQDIKSKIDSIDKGLLSELD